LLLDLSVARYTTPKLPRPSSSSFLYLDWAIFFLKTGVNVMINIYNYLTTFWQKCWRFSWKPMHGVFLCIAYVIFYFESQSWFCLITYVAKVNKNDNIDPRNNLKLAQRRSDKVYLSHFKSCPFSGSKITTLCDKKSRIHADLRIILHMYKVFFMDSLLCFRSKHKLLWLNLIVEAFF
jgi:hypothetical protein